MGFQINSNIPAQIAQDNLRLTTEFQQKTISRVTSGLRITASGDDAAGLAIANGFRSDIAVLGQGVRNANDALATLQTIDGGINNISKLLDRARTLATQSASGTFTGSRSVLNSEFQSVLTEINRQAQSIGLDSGGTFAKSLSVFIGGGRANGGISEIANGAVAVDLSRSTVDTQSLGLKGVQAVGATGSDIGNGSVSTKVSDILANATNTGSQATAGFTDFYFQGPGFGDSSRVKVSVNTTGVTDVDTLVTAINAAITSAGNGASQAATAFKNAGVTASVNTDVNGAKQLIFRSATTAFQVEAGDRLAGALLGKFEQNAALTGSDTAATVATNGGGTAAGLTLEIDGGPAFTVTVSSSAALSKGQLVNDLNADVTFSASATAYLDGNKVVLRSKGNSATSSVSVSSVTTLSTNLGLTGTATAASASTGADVSTRVQGSVATASGASTFGAAGAGVIKVRVTGAGLSSPVDVDLTVTSTTTVAQAITSLQSAVAANSSLQGAGITLTSVTAANNLVFTSTGGEKFSVDVTGDVQNRLGFGSFALGSGSAVDYATIQGLTYNPTTSAAGADATLEFSINGGASSTNNVTVDLTAGDALAATLASTDTSTSVVNVTANTDNLNLIVNGATFNVTLSKGAQTKNDIAGQINAVISAQGTATVVGNAITLTSNTKGRGGSIQVLAGDANTLLGFAASASPTFGTSRSGASVADALNTAFAADTQLQAAGLQASFGGGQVTVASSNDTFFRVNARGTETAATVVGSGSDTTAATGAFSTVANPEPYTIVANTSDNFNVNADGAGAVLVTLSAGANRTAAEVAAELNNGKLTAAILGNATGATASVNGAGKLVINSNTTGAGSVALTAGAKDALAVLGAGAPTVSGAAVPSNLAIGGATNKLRIAVDGGATVDVTLTTQTAAAGAIATDIQTQVNAALTAAGQTAQVTAAANGLHVQITSNSTGAGSSIAFSAIANDAYTALGLSTVGTTTGREANLGYGASGVTFTGNTVSAAPTTSVRLDAGGASATTAINFTPLENGGDDQVITITANDSSGAAQSAAVTLRNDATNRSGRTLDEAVSAINTALQQSNNATLQQVVAVKDDSSGTEQLRFLSTVSSFKVAVGTSGTPANGVASQGTTLDSAITAGGSSVDISSQSTAESAVTALAAAVSLLGEAQAVVGRGQNQFNFAINLASSQLTNLSSAESRIRDADLAAEAANLTKASISLQAGVAALAQANSAPQAVLSLLRGG